MKTPVSLFFAFFLGVFTHLPMMADATHSAEETEIAAKSKPKVGYSFDRLAENPKVARLFVSEEMLSAAKAEVLKSDRWNFSQVAERLTSILVMHTHSRSTTESIRKDYQNVSKMKQYDLLMQLRSGNVDIMVFGIRGRNRDLSELLIFRFRDHYCSRVVQMTGKLSIDDIANIIKLHKKQL